MGEFTIQCTMCDASFGSEDAYNSHGCIDEEKSPVKIKLEPQEENELENALLGLSSEDFEDISIKCEPADATEEEGDGFIQESEMGDPLSFQNQSGEEESLGFDAECPNSMAQDRILNETETFTENYTHDPGQDEIITGERSKNRPPYSALKNYSCNCKVCGVAFRKKDEFTKHFREHHKTYRPYECSICGKKFLHKHYVNLHMRVHTGEKPYVCKLCPRAYSHKTSFTIHMRIHNGDRPYSCSVCGKKCYDKSGLTSHMRSHTKETPYQCEVCGRRFTHSKSLLVHRRNHTGEKPYVCRFCGKAFRHWHKHKIHVRLHTGERPYKCKVCGKGFPRNDEVSRHMRSHLGIKSFKCSICGVYCATQASITGHINLHHFNLKNEDLEPPPEKTLVKNSTSGILGTKVPEPRSMYRIASKILGSTSKLTASKGKLTENQSLTSKPSTRVIEVTSKDTPISIPSSAKKSSRKLNCFLPNTSPVDTSQNKTLNYREFLEWQERMLTNQGLIVKGYSAKDDEITPQITDNKASEKQNVQGRVATTSTPLIKTEPGSLATLSNSVNMAFQSSAAKPQYLLLSPGGEGNVTKILLPINMVEPNNLSKPVVAGPSTVVRPTNPTLKSGSQVPGIPSTNRLLLLPQAVSSQPIFLITNNGQRMLLMTQGSRPIVQSSPSSGKLNQVTVKQEVSEASELTIKTEKSSPPQSPKDPNSDINLKQEPDTEDIF